MELLLKTTTEFRLKNSSQLLSEILQFCEQNMEKAQFIILYQTFFSKNESEEVSRELMDLIFNLDSSAFNENPTDKHHFFVFMRWAPERVAEQLTWIHIQMFNQVNLFEFQQLGWQKQDKASRSPNLTMISQYFNELSGWVTSCILMAYKSNEFRPSQVLAHFVRVCAYLNRLNNFHIMLAVLSGIKSWVISRLEKPWQISSETMGHFHKCELVLSSDQNYKRYRQRVREVSPVLPCMAVTLSDLTFISEGNPTFEKSSGKINWTKFQMIGKELSLIKEAQALVFNYNITADPVQVKYLRYLIVLDEESKYTLSREVEPSPKKNRSAKSKIPSFEDIPQMFKRLSTSIRKSVSSSDLEEYMIFQKDDTSSLTSSMPILFNQEISLPSLDEQVEEIEEKSDNSSIELPQLSEKEKENLKLKEKKKMMQNSGSFVATKFLSKSRDDLPSVPAEEYENSFKEIKKQQEEQQHQSTKQKRDSTYLFSFSNESRPRTVSIIQDGKANTWICSICRLENIRASVLCSSCEYPKGTPKISISKTSYSKETWTCNRCSLVNSTTLPSCSACNQRKESSP